MVKTYRSKLYSAANKESWARDENGNPADAFWFEFPLKGLHGDEAGMTELLGTTLLVKGGREFLSRLVIPNAFLITHADNGGLCVRKRSKDGEAIISLFLSKQFQDLRGTKTIQFDQFLQSNEEKNHADNQH